MWVFMNTESDKYEILVKNLLSSQLLEGCPATNFKVFHGKKYIGKSGQQYAIDVSAEFKIAQVNFLVLVECKYYSRNVDIGDVLKFAARIEDISAHKGILVSTVGFQKGAIKFAKANGIALVKASDLGWVPYIGDPVIPLQNLITQLQKCLHWFHDNLKLTTKNIEWIPVFAQMEQHYHVKGEFCSLRGRVLKEKERMKFYPISTESDCLNAADFVKHGYTFVGGESDLVVDNNGLFTFCVVEFALMSNPSIL